MKEIQVFMSSGGSLESTIMKLQGLSQEFQVAITSIINRLAEAHGLTFNKVFVRGQKTR
jgi:hypothetical protein